ILYGIPWNALWSQKVHSPTIGDIGAILIVVHYDRDPRFGFRSLLDKGSINLPALKFPNDESAKIIFSEHSTKRGRDTQRSTVRGHYSRGASEGKVHFFCSYFRSDTGEPLNIIKYKIDIKLS